MSMLPLNPYSTDLSTPGSIFGTSGQNQMMNGNFASGQSTPYVWGQGGAKLTPDQLALRQKQAIALQQSDYSPVSSPWQGLARASGQWLGAFEQNGLDKEAAAQAADSKASIAALLGGGDTQTSAVAAALSGTDPVAQKLAMEIYKSQHPAAKQPGSLEQNYNFINSIDPTLGASYIRAEANPQVLGTNPETGALAFYPKGGSPSVGQPQGIPKPKTRAEYNAIPKGSQFIDDDGVTKVKS